MRAYRLSELYDNVSTNSLSRALLYENGDVLNLHYGDIHLKYSGLLDINKAELPFALKTDYKFKESSRMETGDVIFADAAEDYEGIGKAIEIGQTGATPSYAGLHTIHLKRKTDVLASGYMGYLSQAYAFRRKVWFIAQGAKVLGISSKELLKQSIVIPNIAEQNTIVSRLKAVDQKINLLTKKKLALEAYKKGLMQKIFSQELRFKREDGTDYPDWANYCLHELYENIPTNSLSREFLHDHGDFRNLHYGDIHLKYSGILNINTSDLPFALKTDYKFKEGSQVETGDVIFADAAEDYNGIGKAVEIGETDAIATYAGLHTIHLKLKTDKLTTGFMGYFTQGYSFRRKVWFIAQGAKVLGISSKEILKQSILLPSLEEQIPIVELFIRIDLRLKLVEEILENCKKQKKGLLQQMFV
jgi:type I restriction enzyme S subunit